MIECVPRDILVLSVFLWMTFVLFTGAVSDQKCLERVKVKTESQDPTSSWRSLIPVIKVSVSTGHLAFGNHYQPQTLCINFDDAFLTYTTKPPSSHLDQFMHIVKESLRMSELCLFLVQDMLVFKMMSHQD
ncbi:bridge-like lipid transfer protein family member 1 [Tamandua tetradactyla]|uniref:bridge-like lipid transfer protein family member 1 n=1 Tax=Tamandua tetradactyla TaxID=48850 RepID=UPI0040547610